MVAPNSRSIGIGWGGPLFLYFSLAAQLWYDFKDFAVTMALTRGRGRAV
jgi:hypothetical protein